VSTRCATIGKSLRTSRRIRRRRRCSSWLAEQLIEQKSGAFDPSEFRDPYRDAVLEMAGQGQRPGARARQAPELGKVINLMDALKRSLEQAKPAAESRQREAAGTKAASGGGVKKRRKAG
jgi:DNA end-binding protein Ku